MHPTRLAISRALLLIARRLLLADKHRYIHDPSHRNKPHGDGWRKTPRGWTTAPDRAPAPQGERKPPAKAEFRPASPKQMAKTIARAKESVGPRDRWRVDAHEPSAYANCRNFTTKGGSCVSVEPDGNIISVCRHDKSNERGSALLRKAVQNGGDRLDAFGPKLFSFYTRNGFEPVAVTKFDKNYAPEGWVDGVDDEEAIVFYKYTGKPYNGKGYDQFVAETPPMDYDDAKAYRDSQLRRK